MYLHYYAHIMLVSSSAMKLCIIFSKPSLQDSLQCVIFTHALTLIRQRETIIQAFWNWILVLFVSSFNRYSLAMFSFFKTHSYKSFYPILQVRMNVIHTECEETRMVLCRTMVIDNLFGSSRRKKEILHIYEFMSAWSNWIVYSTAVLNISILKWIDFPMCR